MKKTLSILAVAALSMSAATSYAKDVTLRSHAEYIESPTVATVIAPGATLINSETGNVVVYDLNDASTTNDTPFDVTQGMIVWGIDLDNKYNNPITLSDVSQDAIDLAVRVSPGDVLVLDFTAGALKLGGPTDAEYMVLMFHGRKDPSEPGYAEWYSTINDFAEWYSTNEVPIIARFTDGDYLAYVIDDACDKLTFDGVSNEVPNSSSTIGGLVFFNESVQGDVKAREVDPDTITPAPEPSPSVPEPTTATLSLLALAGLAARRRRR